MKRIVRLTESDLTRIVRRVIMEQENTGTFSTLEIEWKRLKKAVQSGSSEWTSKGESLSKDLDKSIEALKKGGKDAAKYAEELKKKYWDSWSFGSLIETYLWEEDDYENNDSFENEKDLKNLLKKLITSLEKES
jgi:hypothetical protein